VWYEFPDYDNYFAMFDPLWFGYDNTYQNWKYTIEQGSTITGCTIEIYNRQGTEVNIGNPDAMITVLFIKGQPVAGYSTSGLTGQTFWNSGLTYQSIDGWSGKNIYITINAATSSKFPAGDLFAITKIRKSANVSEYKTFLAKVRKGLTIQGTSI
jgi:hypothetical protein